MGLVRDLKNVRHLLFLAHYIFSVNVALRSISILIADCHFRQDRYSKYLMIFFITEIMCAILRTSRTGEFIILSD